jgi:hypothetical protein
MTLTELLTTLDTRQTIPASRLKDCKTSCRYFAQAYGYATPDDCPLDAAWQDPARWTPALETHFATLEAQGKAISVKTRANTRNNLRLVFRLAEASGLFAAPRPPALVTLPRRDAFQRQQVATTPYRAAYAPKDGLRHYRIPQAQWPPEIQAQWQVYRAEASLHIRESTLHAHVNYASGYIGYLVYVCGHTPTWDDLFERDRLRGFLTWHAARVQRAPLSPHGLNVARTFAAIAKRMQHPQAQALADLCHTLKQPPPLKDKQDHWVSLADVERTAEACLAAGRVPPTTGTGAYHPGSRRALGFQRGVILKLLVRIPLRSRNIREMQLGKHLRQDRAGHWLLRFRGDDLKIGNRREGVNTYEVDLTDYCPDFLPVLHEFLTVYRPRLPGAGPTGPLFLTQNGRPYSTRGLHQELADAVGLVTGQRFFPHMIRTIWATECLEKERDLTLAATMLGDTVKTVLTEYHDVLTKDVHARGRSFLSTALAGTGTG